MTEESREAGQAEFRSAVEHARHQLQKGLQCHSLAAMLVCARKAMDLLTESSVKDLGFADAGRASVLQGGPREEAMRLLTLAARSMADAQYEFGGAEAESSKKWWADLDKLLAAAPAPLLAERGEELFGRAMIVLKGLNLSVEWELAPEIKKEIADICAEFERADAVLAEREPAPKWISVKDRLPENGQQVLGISDKGTMGTITAPFSTIVAHWMPLPDPPRGPSSPADKRGKR